MKNFNKGHKKGKSILKEKAELLQKSNQNPFAKNSQAFHRTTTNHMVEGDFTTVKNRTIVTHHTIWWQAKQQIEQWNLR